MSATLLKHQMMGLPVPQKFMDMSQKDGQLGQLFLRPGPHQGRSKQSFKAKETAAKD